MNQKENIKIKLKKSGDNYKVINNNNNINNNSLLRKQENDNYLNRTVTYKRSSTITEEKKSKTQPKDVDINKGTVRFRSWISCPCIYCNVIDEDKIILAAQFALEQAKKEITGRRTKYAKK